MKNKREDQIAARKNYRLSLRRLRGVEPELVRKKASRIEKPIILIVCEGENTEPSYFRRFKLSTAVINQLGKVSIQFHL